MNAIDDAAPEALYANWKPTEMLEVILSDPDDFLKIRETLSRIGVASKRSEKKLIQSCHILHKQGRYFIVHFKELFLLDGNPSSFMIEDFRRRNTITVLLSDWGLLKIGDPSKATDVTSLRHIKIISHADKADWTLEVKYRIGQFSSKH